MKIKVDIGEPKEYLARVGRFANLYYFKRVRIDQPIKWNDGHAKVTFMGCFIVRPRKTRYKPKPRVRE